MRFVCNGDQKHWFMWTIVFVGYPKELENFLDKHSSPFYSCFADYGSSLSEPSEGIFESALNMRSAIHQDGGTNTLHF